MSHTRVYFSAAEDQGNFTGTHLPFRWG